MGQDYKLVTVATRDGRLLSGIVREKTESGLTFKRQTTGSSFRNEDIEAMKPSNTSMMPEGLFEKLSDNEVRPDRLSWIEGASRVAGA